ncbi:hypothetical protein J2Z21_007817 [Streptomyces griseochromogenes]|uniref:Peptidase C83 domain-containing protein n=1 Tax=Streptomyces griseochromogenes TaxID=68214 RepID=A0A1B1BAV9_9ACTN|nr:hypothetical protein [Streptomyces griseochromogenes]ANP55899.1 hypothetical protein AVL59_45475 [Streptomyces griseochromogenes]MBP2054807.1 hypothetical protein [Streptomyces griseochromogenes]
MSDQPYQGGPYEGYDPYQQHQQHQQHQEHQQHQAQQAWSGYDQYAGQAGQYEQTGYDPQDTQQWQGQTWETQTHASMPAEGTAYPPQEAHQQQYHQQAYQQQYQQPYAQPTPTPTPAPEPASAPAPQPQPSAAPEPEHADEADPSYGPATLAGNTRVTDAQRARSEGRSPIIAPGMQPAALTALLGVLLAATAPVASYALVVPLVLLQAVTAAGWFRLNGMWPARQGIALAFAGGLTADVAVLAAGRDHAPVAILGPLGVWVLLSLVLQLRSHASPDERMYGLMATVVSAALTVLATGYLAADPDAVSVGAAAVAVAVLARALPLPGPASVVASVLAAAGAGIAVGGMTGFGAKGAALGAAAGVCALVGHRVASYDYPSRFVHFTAGVALPLSAAAPVVWVLGRALG